MVDNKCPLGPQELRQLRKLVRRESNGSLPLDELASLAQLPEEVGITIDFEAAEVLGHPLVVLRPMQGAGEREPSALAELSPRELEVAALVACGLGNKEIAHRLHITLGTVKDHVHNMLGKTGLANRTALATAFRARANVPARGGAVNPSLDRK